MWVPRCSQPLGPGTAPAPSCTCNILPRHPLLHHRLFSFSTETIPSAYKNIAVLLFSHLEKQHLLVILTSLPASNLFLCCPLLRNPWKGYLDSLFSIPLLPSLLNSFQSILLPQKSIEAALIKVDNSLCIARSILIQTDSSVALIQLIMPSLFTHLLLDFPETPAGDFLSNSLATSRAPLLIPLPALCLFLRPPLLYLLYLPGPPSCGLK